jgi:hypothetical protein
VTDMRDELLERVVDDLRTLPPVDEAAIRRIVTAASEDENAMGAARFEVRRSRWWQSRVPLAAAAGLALAAGLAGYAVRGGPTATSGTTITAVRAESIASLASSESAVRSPQSVVPTQFILEAPRASRVALVGDFNAWDADQTPLLRDPSSGIWTVMVRLAPGRHVYAFMVDGTAWTLDPRAPTAQDPEFGTPSSVVLVGTP